MTEPAFCWATLCNGALLRANDPKSAQLTWVLEPAPSRGYFRRLILWTSAITHYENLHAGNSAALARRGRRAATLVAWCGKLG